MSYRPHYKNSNGVDTDLPIDAETIKGKEITTSVTSSSDDTKIPTAKAVSDFVASAITTALNTAV